MLKQLHLSFTELGRYYALGLPTEVADGYAQGQIDQLIRGPIRHVARWVHPSR
jgi:hypothetical protein